MDRTSGDNYCPSGGNWYAGLGMDVGNWARAPIWMVAAYDGTAPGGVNSVSMNWRARNKAACGGIAPCTVISYVGTTPPTGESTFTEHGSLHQTEWTYFSRSATNVTLTADNTIYVALGWRNSADDVEIEQVAGWDQIVGFDCVSVTITTNSFNEP